MESQAPRTRAPSAPVALPDPSVFDLEAYAAHYTDRRKVQRLLFVARSCPALAMDAFALAIATLEQTSLDVQLYEQAVQEHNAALEGLQRELASSSKPSQAALNAADRKAIPLNQAWVKATRDKAEREQDKLEVELKSYQSNVIKESIRMGHRDLANFHHKAGDLQAAIRMHTKTRDYCAMSSHVVDMCLAVIEVALELANYAIVKNYVIKAEAALEASAGGSGAQPKAKVVNLPGMVQQGLTKKEEATERARTATIERLSVASGVAEMGQGNYERAAFLLLKGTANARGDDAQHYISPADIALYAVFCGLATMDRQQIKRRLLENAELRPLLEGESWLKELMAAFHESRYQRFLELLATYNPRPALDLHLSAQLKQLLPRIQNRAVVQYFQPYGSVSLGKMALAFGWQEDKMLKQIVELVSSGQLQARIDSKNKIIKAHKPSQRAALFKEALEIGEQTERASHALVTRIKLIQADLIVKDRAARDDD